MSFDWNTFGGISSMFTGGIPYFGLASPDALQPVDWSTQDDTQKYALGTSPEMLEARARAVQMLQNPTPTDYQGRAAAAYAGPVAGAQAKTGGVGMGGVSGDMQALRSRAAMASSGERSGNMKTGFGVKNSVDDWNLRQDALREGLLARERAKLAREQAAKKKAVFDQEAANMENVAGNLEGMGSMMGGGGGGGGMGGMMGGMMGGGGGGGGGGGAAGAGSGANVSGEAAMQMSGYMGGGSGGGGGSMAPAIVAKILKTLAPSVQALGQTGNSWDDDYYARYYGGR